MKEQHQDIQDLKEQIQSLVHLHTGDTVVSPRSSEGHENYAPL